MACSCANSNNVGNIQFIDELMDYMKYFTPLKSNLKESLQEFGLDENWRSKQDNGPKQSL